MSVVRCYWCERQFDQDKDAGDWIEIGNMRRQTQDVWACESCLIEQEEIEQDRRDQERDDNGQFGVGA